MYQRTFFIFKSPDGDPSLEEIEARARRERQNWNKKEKRRRTQCKLPEWLKRLLQNDGNEDGY